jgi:hypothetical protein
MHEMETLQRRMEELQRQYMKDKETYRLQLISTLLAARKTQVIWSLIFYLFAWVNIEHLQVDEKNNSFGSEEY